MVDNEPYNNIEHFEQSQLRERIHTSQEQQHLEAALALSLQEYKLATTRKRTNNYYNDHHQTISNTGRHQKQSPLLAAADQSVVLGLQIEKQDPILLRKIQEEQCQILERIQQQQKEEIRRKQGKSPKASVPTHDEHDDQTNGDREERRRRKEESNFARRKPAPDPLRTAPQDEVVKHLQLPRVITTTVTRPGEPFRGSSITTPNAILEQGGKPEALSIKVDTAQKRPQRKTLRRWDIVKELLTQEEEQVIETGHQQKDENLILQQILEEQQQQQLFRNLRKGAPRAPQLQRPPVHVPTPDIVVAEPSSNNVPIEQVSVEHHKKPPQVVAIPLRPQNQPQSLAISTITMDHELTRMKQGPGQILIKLGRILNAPQPYVLPSSEVTVTCEGCKAQLQVDRNYSMVFCPRCNTISSTSPPPAM